MVFGAFFFARSTAAEASSDHSLSPTVTFIREFIFVFTHIRLQRVVLRRREVVWFWIPLFQILRNLEHCALLAYYAAVVIPYRRFGTTYRSHLQGSRIRTDSCPGTSVRNYHYSLSNDPEERSSKLLRGGSLKSRTVYEILFINSVNVSRQRFEPSQGFYPHSTIQIRR